MGYSAEQARQRYRTGKNLLAGAAILHLVAIPVSLLLFADGLSESQARALVGWGVLFDALSLSGVLLVGIFGQVALAIANAVGATLLAGQRAGNHVPMLVVGAIAVFFSFALFGGILGAIAGFLTIAGRSAARPQGISQTG